MMTGIPVNRIAQTESNKLVPVFVHSHHIHQHEVDEKFGIKRPIHIDHIVCF